ncbi:glycosyltransferase [Nostoc sp. HG1]|nr:glycosyltransferase [Nostoc sp. HG1]
MAGREGAGWLTPRFAIPQCSRSRSFPYNRGAYLENCVASLRRHLPGVRVRVWDDHSDRPETLAVLDGLGVEVIRPPRGVTGRLGGLYGNMQRHSMRRRHR